MIICADMCVFMCICITYVPTHSGVYIVYIHVYICMHVQIVCISVCTCVHMHVQTSAYSCACVHMCIYSICTEPLSYPLQICACCHVFALLQIQREWMPNACLAADTQQLCCKTALLLMNMLRHEHIGRAQNALSSVSLIFSLSSGVLGCIFSETYPKAYCIHSKHLSPAWLHPSLRASNSMLPPSPVLHSPS